MTFKSLIEKISKGREDLSPKEWNFFFSELYKKRQLNKEEWKKEIEKILNETTKLDRLIESLEKLKEKTQEEEYSEQNRVDILRLYLSIIEYVLQNIDLSSGFKKDNSHIKIGIHTINQLFGDNKQLSLFSEEKIDHFKDSTGLNLTNRPDSYGVVLNQAQRKVLEGILKAFTSTNYKGDEIKDRATALKEVYSNSKSSGEVLSKNDNAPYKNIEAIPVIKITQAEIIELSGYTKRQGDKQHVINALNFLATNQFCFYWIRLKTENEKPVRDKRGDYVKEEVMEVATLLRVKTVRNPQTGLLDYYEIEPSAPMLDQVNNYFLLVPNNWRDEVKEITGRRASSYTYEFLMWLRLQHEQIRRFNKNGGKNRKPKPYKISRSWEEIAIALKMPESMYKRNRPRSKKIIQEAYSVAIKLGYLDKVENNGATDVLYLNESHYPKPGKLV